MGNDVQYTDPSRQSELPPYDDEAAAEYVNDLRPIKESRQRTKRKRIVALLLFLVLAAGTAGYFLFLLPSNKSEPQVPQAPAVPPSQVPQTVETKEYSSAAMNLSFSYPSNWKVDDDSQGLVRVESPVLKLADLNGEQADAKVVLSFLTSGSEVPGFDDTAAIAVRDSEKLSYANPSQNQRGETYMSFAGFGTRGLHALLITGDSGYQVDQLIPEADIKKGDPIIVALFYACTDAACAGDGAGMYAISSEGPQNEETIQAVKDVLTSLRVE